jgi:hypothetical protein
MTAEDIVQRLAVHPEPLQYSTQRCALCNMHADGTGQNHDPLCAWRLAKEYVTPALTKAVVLTHPGAQIVGPIAPKGTVYVDKDGTPRGVSDGTKIVAIDVELTPVFEPEEAGSGTGRYGDGADHWTQNSDGTDYPGSYGVGPVPVGGHVALGSDGQPLQRFVPYAAPAEPPVEETVAQEPSGAVPTERFASVSGVSSEGAPQADHN